MIIFPDHNAEIEYTDPNGSVWDWNGVGWVRQCACSGGGNVVLLLPVTTRSGSLQLPLNQSGDAVPVSLRSGPSELPLSDSGSRFTVNTRSGDLDLPLMAA